MKRVVVGLSGGVDSSVAAYLLKKEGYEVIGIFMKNWHDESVLISKECSWVEDSNDAMIIAEKIGIPFQTIDLSEVYKTRIVDYMFSEYQKGRTPNPDILCNREIKFDVFLNIATQLKADFVATGHYCRKSSITKDNNTIYQLFSGNDNNKDQSYFLCQLSQYQLRKALFPIGHLSKQQVREIAKEQGFITADKKDSQGLCFIGKVKLPEFLKQQLRAKEGRIIEVDAKSPIYEKYSSTFKTKRETLQNLSKKWNYTEQDGKQIGKHQGAHFFTTGQRKGLNVGGKKEPLYIIGTETKNNLIFVGEGKDHPGLWRNALEVNNQKISWLREDLKISKGKSLRMLARIRYRQPLQKATLYNADNKWFIVFEKLQSAITSGQFVAWYLEDELIGSGVIE